MRMWQIILFACLVSAQVKVPEEIIKSLMIELEYESILVVDNKLTSCVIDLQVGSTTPIVNFNENQDLSIKTLFNRRFLVLLCLGNNSTKPLKVLSKNLEGMRDAAILLMVNDGVNISLHNAFKCCLRNKMLNVLAIRNWKQDDHIYSYRAFPRLTLVKRHISEVDRFFVPQLRNMGGHPIETMPDNVLPRTVYYKDASGQPQMAGYLAPFLNNFARTLNATVKISWKHVPLDEPEEMIGRTGLYLMGKGIVDIPLSLMNIASTIDHTSLIASYVMEISTWQLIVPVEAELKSELLIFAAATKAHIYLIVLVMTLFALMLHYLRIRELEKGEGGILRCLYQLIDPVLRATLYQTFVLPRRPSERLKAVYYLLFFFSFVSYNIYVAQLEMLLIHPPRETPIRTYQDLRKAGLKILLTADDNYLMKDSVGRHHMNEFWDVYEIVNRSIFQTLRRQPNSSYAYPITHTLWPLIERKFAKQPFAPFRLSKEFTFLSLVPFGLPLPQNSIYEEALNRYILNTHCSGLYGLWFHQTFQSLVEIGKLEVLPYQSIGDTLHLLRCGDLYLVWVLFLCHIGVAITAFVFEVGLANVHLYINYI
ncbi:hypothetical protein KR044_011182, partial [Drosophila immigrans]